MVPNRTKHHKYLFSIALKFQELKFQFRTPRKGATLEKSTIARKALPTTFKQVTNYFLVKFSFTW